MTSDRIWSILMLIKIKFEGQVICQTFDHWSRVRDKIYF